MSADLTLAPARLSHLDWLESEAIHILRLLYPLFRLSPSNVSQNLYHRRHRLLNARPAAPRFGWFNFGLMLLGTLMVEWAQWTGRADVLFTSYVPLKAHPLYYLGIEPV